MKWLRKISAAREESLHLLHNVYCLFILNFYNGHTFLQCDKRAFIKGSLFVLISLCSVLLSYTKDHRMN